MSKGVLGMGLRELRGRIGGGNVARARDGYLGELRAAARLRVGTGPWG